jgi:hypothetical protein
MTTEVSEWLGGRAVALSGLTPGSGTADLQRHSYLRGFGAVVGRFTDKTTLTATVLAEELDGVWTSPGGQPKRRELEIR